MKIYQNIFFFCLFCCAGQLLFALDDTPFKSEQLTGRVLVLTQAPWAETMTVIDAETCLVVVDTWGSLSNARKAAAFIDSLLHKPVRYVINTHHHWDHTFGNAAFPDAVIVGHRFCSQDMQADYGDSSKRALYFRDYARQTEPVSLAAYIAATGHESACSSFKLVPPSHLAATRDTLRAGDVSFILYHTPGIHTRSNVTILVPELGILFCRREFTDRATMKLEPGADPVIIEQVIQEINASAKPIQYLIPGHGAAIANPSL